MTNTEDFKIKIVKCCSKSLQNIRTKMYDYLGTTKLQSYFPILDNYFEFYNGSKNDFTLKSRFRVTEILEKENHKIDDSYVKNFLICRVRDVSSGEEKDINIFVKTLPLLNVTHYLTNEYSLSSTILPNLYFQDTIKKINNPNNSAYIDVFFSYLGSRLSEKGKCPTFPIFYGTYSGIMDEFKVDISEDYDDLKDDDDFLHLLGDTFSLEDAKIEQEPLINEELLNNGCDIEVDNVDIILGDILDNELDLDDNSDRNSDNELDLEDGNSDRNSDNELDLEDGNSDRNESINNIVNDVVTNIIDEVVQDNTSINQLQEVCEDIDKDNSEDKDNTEDKDGVWEDLSDSENSLSDEDRNESSNENFTIDSLLRDEIDNEIKILESDCSFSDISESSNNSDILKYAKIPDFPVQFNFIETLDGTLDNYIDNSINKRIPPTEWKSILFQICFGLAVAQKHYLFVHNDLHSSNIMFKKTETEFLYYKFSGRYFKIPTFNKISKIIDFGRGTFKVGNKIYFSDVFMKNEDAWGQYTYPNSTNTLKHCRIKPNMSFDLSRFATTIIERFECCDEKYDEIKNLVQLWMKDRYGNDLSQLEEDFDLYKIIARNVKSAHPKSQLNKRIWDEFVIQEEDIPKSEFIYKF
jgi:hypothetical protein